MKSVKYSRLAQSRASLPTTTTRALVSALRTKRLYCRMQQNLPSWSIEQRLYLATSRQAKVNKGGKNIRPKEGGNKRCLCNQRNYVQKRQRSQGVEDTRRQLCQVVRLEISESNKERNPTSIQGWLNLMPHCPSPPELWLHCISLGQNERKLQVETGGGVGKANGNQQYIWMTYHGW